MDLHLFNNKYLIEIQQNGSPSSQQQIFKYIDMLQKQQQNWIAKQKQQQHWIATQNGFYLYFIISKQQITIPRNENNDEKQKSTTHNNKTTTSRQQSTTTKQINFSEIMHSLYFLDVFIVLLKQVQLNNHYKKYLIILAFRRKGFIFIFIFETSACNNNDKKY